MQENFNEIYELIILEYSDTLKHLVKSNAYLDYLFNNREVIKNLANILKLKLPQLIKTVLTTFSEFPNELISTLYDFFIDNLTVRDVLFSIEE